MDNIYSSNRKTALNPSLKKETRKYSTTLKYCLEMNYQMTKATPVTHSPQGIYLLPLFFAKSFLTNNNGLHHFILGIAECPSLSVYCTYCYKKTPGSLP